jgi:hypothetical protein
MRRRRLYLLVITALTPVAAILVPASARAADADTLVGIHFWGLKDGTRSYSEGIDEIPAQMLDSRARGAWDVEVVNTHGDEWQKAPFFVPLYRDLYTNKKTSIATRLEYRYGMTVPSPSTINTATWAGNVVASVNQLKDWAHVWQLGNEPNLIGEGNGWANNQITPAGYAGVYGTVRAAIHNDARVGPPGPHQLLVAPVSPGGVISGVRWKDGNQYLSETIDALRAANTPIDGFALHAYGGGATTADALRDFRNGFAQQVAIIDAKGQTSVPIHITEWNRYADPNAPNAAQQEALAADFARSAFRMLDRWNRTPGNHNIVSAGWFVYEKSPDITTWDGYSIDYWKDHGNPRGSAGDLYTAFSDAARAGYRAGLIGTRPLPAGVQIIDDFETSDGHFTWTPTQSPTTVGALTTSSKVRTADDSYTKAYGQKVSVVDDPSRSNGWYVRYVSGGGAPSANTAIPLTEGADGNVGFFLRVLSNSNPGSGPLTTQLVLDSGTTGGGPDSDAGVPTTVIQDGEWHYYEWDVDDPSDWTAWRDINGSIISGSDGLLPAVGQVTIDSIIFRGGNANVQFYLDGVMRNASGSLSAMLPVPEPTAAMLLVLAMPVIAMGRPRTHAARGLRPLYTAVPLPPR